MQLSLPLPPASVAAPRTIRVGPALLVAEFVRHRRARHYILRVTERGTLRVTIPLGGSLAEAERFVRERGAWIRRERFRQLTRPARLCPWADGAVVLLRGEAAVLRVVDAAGRRRVELGDMVVPLPGTATTDLRPTVERALRVLAAERLPARLLELAQRHGLSVTRVTIRSQRTRWGSCSPAGHISLNWRLVQAPPEVSDYVLLHELAHLVVPSHSRRFWRTLERMCPSYRDARAWLHARRDDL